jgi:flagellar M-ring protein FliF
MAGNRSAFLKQLLDIWARLEITQKFTIGVFTVLVLASLGVLVFFMNRVEYEVLYRDLNSEDAQAIATKLKADKREYLVQGNAILVAAPKADLDKLRLDIAGSGLGRSGKVGYEIFDKNQFGMTDFTEQINLQRALEGELARTISSLSEISQARVHLVLPKDSLFEEKKEDAKASVVVGLKSGAELNSQSIAGIKNLVAGAVSGLRTNNVSIVDEKGKLLSQSAAGEDSRTELQSGVREELEREMTSKVVSILEPVVGRDKVHAKASIDLDFNSTEQTEETFNPNPPTVLSQQKTEERMGGANLPSGVAGTQSNQPGGQALGTSSSPERLRQSEVTNYEVSKLVRHTVQPKGTVRRLSVAVILDHKTNYAKGADGKVSSTLQPRTQQELDAYRELVLAAVGFDKERGDVVTLENVPFFNENRPEEERPPLPWHIRWQQYLLPGMKYGAFLLLFLLVYFILVRPIRKRVFQAIPMPTPALAYSAAGEGAGQIAGGAPMASLAGGTVSESMAALGSGESAPALPAADQPDMQPENIDLDALDEKIEREFMKEAQVADLGGRKYAVLKNKLIEKTKKDPEMISQLVRSWLLQEKD